MKVLSPSTLLATSLLLLSSCQELTYEAVGYAFDHPNQIRTTNQRVSSGSWDKPAHLQGDHVIIIDRRSQQAKYYIGNVQVGYSTISSGSAGRDTPAGTYTVLEKDIDHRSSRYGSWVSPQGEMIQLDYTMGDPKPTPDGKYLGAPMFHGMKLNNTGIWMHEGVVTSAPESHGCIRLPAEMAKIFYENTPLGTTVIVQ